MYHPKGPTLLELTRQALSSTTRGYDMLAPKFDYTPFRTPDVLLEPVAEAVGGPGSIGSALDVCCGTGAAMRILRPLCTEHVTGIDLSQGMLDEAERRLATAPGSAQIRLLRQDVMTMDFDQEFDVVTCFGAFGHVLHDDQDAFAKRIRAALKPGGRFIFITHPMPPVLSKPWIISRGFNAVMHVRNALINPPFIMFYLTFPIERAREVLTRHGFTLSIETPYGRTDHPSMQLVVATKSRG